MVQKAQGKDFVFDKITNDESGPIEDGKYLTQRIAALDILSREEAIASTIETMLQKYDTVFIAYGSSHYRLEHKILKAYFGEPELIDKF